MSNPLSNPDTLNLNPDWPEDLTEARYDGDYQCAVSEDGPCRKVAAQVWREPFTPAAFPVIACDEHADGLRAMGYHFDSGATAQLYRDVEKERRTGGGNAMKGHCQQCGRRVEIDVPPDGHTRTEHSPRCDGHTCAPDCPIPVLCGPVDAEQETEREKTGGDSMSIGSYIGAPEDEPGYWDDKSPEDEPPQMYGLKLVAYDGQPMDMWVFDGSSRLELTHEEIVDARRAYSDRNPKGRYSIEAL